MRRCALVSDASDVLVEGFFKHIGLLIFLVRRHVVTAVVCIRFMFCLMCELFVCFDVGSVFLVVECSLILLSKCCMLCKRMEWMCGMLRIFTYL